MSEFKIWLNTLCKKLRSIFTEFIDDKVLLKKLFAKDKMILWIKAFTHISYNVNQSYETLEHIGDTVCDWAFKAYVMSIYPDRNPIVYTYLTNRYMEKVFQRTVTKRYSLETSVRGSFHEGFVPFTVAGDVFESMVGALFLAGEVLGFYLVFKFIQYIMSKEPVNLVKMQQGPGITQVEQIFKRLSLPAPVTREVVNRKGSITLSLHFERESITAIEKKLKITVPSTVATCTRSCAKHAQKDLYELASKELASLGLSTHMAKKFKSDLDLDAPSMQPWKETIEAYIKENNFSYLYKNAVKCTSDDRLYIVRIFGVRKDAVQSSQLLFSTWTSTCNEYSTQYAYARMFPAISTHISRSLTEDVQQYMSSLDISQSDPMDNKMWIRSLRNMLNDVFKTFIDDRGLRSKLLDMQHMKRWITTFTDETCNVTNNNISLVQLGHNVIRSALAYQVLNVFPQGDPALLSNMNIYFIEGDRQAELSQQLNLFSEIRCFPAGLKRHSYYKQTSFQAFMGMLSQIDLMGPVLCFKFMRVHFPGSKLNIEMAKIGSPERHLELIFSTLMVQPPQLRETVDGKNIRYCRKRGRSEQADKDCEKPAARRIKPASKEVHLSMHLTRKIQTDLQNKGLTCPTKYTLATVKGVDSKALHRSLNRTALSVLHRTGITLPTARYFKWLTNLHNPTVAPYRGVLEEYLKERGVSWVQIQSIDKISRNNVKYMYVVGHKKHGQKVLLHKTWCPKSFEISDVLKEWLSATFPAV